MLNDDLARGALRVPPARPGSGEDLPGPASTASSEEVMAVVSRRWRRGAVGRGRLAQIPPLPGRRPVVRRHVCVASERSASGMASVLHARFLLALAGSLQLSGASTSWARLTSLP